MPRKSEPHEIVRRIEDGDPEQDFPCFVGHGGHVDTCERPPAVMAYGLTFCEVHGAEIRNGAVEEMHQQATEWFERFDNPNVPALDNPLVLQAVRGWERTLREEDLFSAARTDELLLAAFPFKRDKVWQRPWRG